MRFCHLGAPGPVVGFANRKALYMHQCWHDQRPYDEDTPWRVTSNEMNSSTESEGSHCKPSLASVAVPPCSARARASSYCLKARVLPTPGSARAHAWQRPSKTPQRPQPALQRYPIPLTKDPSQRGSDEESFLSVPFGYMYAESQNPNPGRGSRQAGPLFEKDLRFPGRKL